jgi:membrane protein DedA with SNARE-associated domain
MSGVVDWLTAVSGPLALVVIALLVFTEAALFVGFVLPGETAVLVGGVLAATGRISLVVLMVVVVATAILGDTVGYEVGRHLGPRLLRSRPLRAHQHRIQGAQRFLRERGGWAVFLARGTAFLRAVMPALAGASRMPYGRFLAFNAAGGLLWGVAVVLLGFFAGQSYAAVAGVLGKVSAALVAVVVVVGLVVWRRSRRREDDDVGADDAAG